MYLNRFSVRVPAGSESGGYVEMIHGQQYSIRLRNDRIEKCDARVEVDGKHVGTFRIDGNGTMVLERPENDVGCFTFYRLGSPEAAKVGLVNDSNLGLIKVTFTPERHVCSVRPVEPCSSRPHPWVITNPPEGPRRCYHTSSSSSLAKGPSHSYSAGGTGLSGHSSQKFHNVTGLDYDYSQETTIHLRLVAKADEPRPLVAHSSPIPPRV